MKTFLSSKIGTEELEIMYCYEIQRIDRSDESEDWSALSTRDDLNLIQISKLESNIVGWMNLHSSKSLHVLVLYHPQDS